MTGCPANRQSPSADWAAVFGIDVAMSWQRGTKRARYPDESPIEDSGCGRTVFWRDTTRAASSARCCGQESRRIRRCRCCAKSCGSCRLRHCAGLGGAAEAERDLLERGITFTVYSDATAIDRILPFDLIPRVITAQEWHTLEAGVIQRVRALNLFLHDIYHERKILADGVVPRELVLGNAAYCEAMIDFDPPRGTYVHICGTDIIRDDAGRFLVLEDNARTPSGVAYVVENRHMSLRVLSDLMAGLRVRSVDEYGLQLHRAMTEIAPAGISDPQVVLLSPGIFNSAYFEHVFLAREMGVPLVEGQDLLVDDGRVWMRTTAGLARVHTIYRRLNDDFLDPDAFRPDSKLGVRGLIEAHGGAAGCGSPMRSARVWRTTRRSMPICRASFVTISARMRYCRMSIHEAAPRRTGSRIHSRICMSWW